jgi:hypothetical protein
MTLSIDPLCVRRVVPALQADLASIIRALHVAAPRVRVAGMSYWDPFLGLWTLSPIAQEIAAVDPIGKAVAVNNNQSMRELNRGLQSTYQDEGALFADVAGPKYFNIEEFSPLVSTKWGTVPANVATACKWTWFCAGSPAEFDPHPRTTGYGIIADAFQAVLRVRPTQ